MSKLAYVAAALSIISAPALAQIVFDDSAAPAAAPTQSAKAKSDLDKVICRSQEEIGSRLQTHKVCMTAEQWKAYAQAYKDQVQEIQSQASVRRSDQ